MRKSDAVRDDVLATLKQVRQKENDARAYSDGRREVIKESMLEENEVQQTAQAIYRKLAPDWAAKSDITSSMTPSSAPTSTRRRTGS